jgi:TonB family protein
MLETQGTVLDEIEAPSPDLRLIVAHDPWFREFFRNLNDLIQPPQKFTVPAERTADFWPDVFVEYPLPWHRFLESGGAHVLAIAIIWAATRFIALHPQVVAQPAFNHSDVVYYAPSEYLPPLDTRRTASPHPQKADPEFAKQPIISVPPEADNRSQTIVTPPNVRLKHDIALPNTVAWADQPRLPIAPAPLVPASQISRLAPQVDHSVIAPPPTVQDNPRSQTMRAPQAAVIAPPPSFDADSRSRVSDINIGRSTIIAPAPQLPLDEQRTAFAGRSGAIKGRSPQVIAPPPAVGAPGGSRRGNMVALNLHPAVGAPPDTGAGNRRGSFAATPNGHAGASGTPGSSAGAQTENGTAGTNKTNGNLPSGLYVGKSSNPDSSVAGNRVPANTVNPNLLANARPPRISRAAQPDSDIKLTEAERQVFGGRKVHSLSLNMPNLNSGGGSWIIRFAAMHEDAAQPPHADSASVADLSSPVATRKVDPAYPLELMKQNIGGTVILYAVIHADGTVSGVRILRSVDDRLDRFASDAISKWQFQPATKNGSAIDVEATFWIPFHPVRAKTDF